MAAPVENCVNHSIKQSKSLRTRKPPPIVEYLRQQQQPLSIPVTLNSTNNIYQFYPQADLAALQHQYFIVRRRNSAHQLGRHNFAYIDQSPKKGSTASSTTTTTTSSLSGQPTPGNQHKEIHKNQHQTQRKPSRQSTGSGSSFVNRSAGPGGSFSALLAAGSSARLPDSLALCFQKALCHTSFSGPTVQDQRGGGFAQGKHSFQVGAGKKINQKETSNHFAGHVSNFFTRRKHMEKHSANSAPGTPNGTTTISLNDDEPASPMKKPTATVVIGSQQLPPGTAAGVEFRPNKDGNTKGSEKGQGNGGSSQRSKSPGAIIGRMANFARGKVRSSMSEKTANAVVDDKARRDLNREIQRCKESNDHRLDLNSSDITCIPSTIRDLSQLTELFLYKNKLSTLPPELGNLTNLRILGLSENNLSSLPDTLSALKHLETLDLRHNKLNEQIPQVIFQMESIETLWLRYNKISKVSPDIGKLKRLKMIDLRENKITELPKEIGQIQSLSILLMSSNHLKNLPTEIGDCIQLTQLDLQHNELQTLPSSMGQLSSLKRLGIRYNQITELPASLSKCTLLDEFIIESNKLQSLPDGILASLPNLKTINLSRNQLTGLPQGGPNQFEAAVTVNVEHNSISKIPFGIFSKATGLTKLNLKENELTALPLDFGTWTSLTELNVSNNELTELPSDIDKLVNLEVLVLSTNQLKKLPSQIGSLRKLRELDLEENELECIPSDIGFLTSLTKLWVQSNRLSSLPRTIGNLSNLQDLRVGENMLTFIPEEIGHLESLKSLYLNDNQNLHNLPFELALCASLEIMSIERCPLSQIPHDITEGGPSLVIQYLKMQGPYRGILNM
ncbi:leucine rich repeat domain-containing protein [Ditylenchus destructor]|uniref:Leucine rich repeat domain-containing protein n=1 Tax=Ditylenchus destructor TaxID=166010 RepID=A0AAD4R3W8_9BILA|nr:leucine rich repeat domain-containing protein [Ditylenchus destructor]